MTTLMEDTGTRFLTIDGARAVFTEEITDDISLEKLLRLFIAEIAVGNYVKIVVCVSTIRPPQLSFQEGR